MRDPFDPLYRLIKAISRSRFDGGGSLSGRVLAIVLCVVAALGTATLTLVFPKLDTASVFGWTVGVVGVAFFAYSFVRSFFETTTANSEAAARAEDAKNV